MQELQKLLEILRDDGRNIMLEFVSLLPQIIHGTIVYTHKYKGGGGLKEKGFLRAGPPSNITTKQPQCISPYNPRRNELRSENRMPCHRRLYTSSEDQCDRDICCY